MERNADLIKLLETQAIPQNGAHPVQHGTQKGLLVNNDELSEHHSYARMVLVPANDVGFSGCCQQCRYDFGENDAVLFFGLMFSCLQQHKQERLRGALGSLALKRNHSLKQLFLQNLPLSRGDHLRRNENPSLNRCPSLVESQYPPQVRHSSHSAHKYILTCVVSKVVHAFSKSKGWPTAGRGGSNC